MKGRRESPPTRAAARPELSVVIPAYNEQHAIGRSVASVERVVASVCDAYEIVVVDDGSVDATSDELRALAAERPAVRCIENGHNRGKGYSVREGCLVASGEFVMLMDADGDLASERIETFLDRQRETGADVVVGSKRHPESDVTYPLRRRLLSVAYSVLIRLLFGLRVTDTQVGMKLLHRSVVEDVMPLLLVRRYAFDVELLALARHLGYDIAEAPVTLDFNGYSSIDWPTVVRIGWDTLAVFARLNVLRTYAVMHRAVRYARERSVGDAFEWGER